MENPPTVYIKLMEISIQAKQVSQQVICGSSASIITMVNLISHLPIRILKNNLNCASQFNIKTNCRPAELHYNFSQLYTWKYQNIRRNIMPFLLLFNIKRKILLAFIKHLKIYFS